MENVSERIDLERTDALLVVDVQYDFLPGGALAVSDGDAVVPLLRHYIALFRSCRLPVIATRDWHPANHCSFVSQGGPWPPHCIAGTHGAEIAHELALDKDVLIVSKADHADRDAYSGFDGTDLHRRLQDMGVRRLFIGGLATDYCVQATVLDALKLGYAVVVLGDAVRAVEAGDGEKALDRMRRQGAVIASWENLDYARG